MAKAPTSEIQKNIDTIQETDHISKHAILHIADNKLFVDKLPV